MTDHSDLGPRLEGTITALVEAGRYGSRDEVLRAGVRLLEVRESRLAALDASLARGLADADTGRVARTTEVGDRLRTKYEKQAETAGR